MDTMNSANAPASSGEIEAIPFPYEITFVDSDTSPAVRTQIEEQLTRLSRFYDRITSARVMVRIPHKHGNARTFHIHVQLDLPGKVLTVTREPEATDKHTDIRLATKDAFQKVTRQLEDFVKQRNCRKGLGAADEA